MPSNAAAWLVAPKTPLEVKSAPYTSPGKNEMVIKNQAVAINPIDYLKQDMGDMIFGWIKYPFIHGIDVAGEVVEIGANVTRFRVGDRVVSHAVATSKDYNTATKGAFQNYTVLLAHMAAPIPNTMSYESAVVLPLGLSTAACGLFQKDQLALPPPSSSGSPKSPGQTLLVWGGSTSVGSNAIQLAVAAGYEVITTASPKNFDYVKKLGASQVFDYKSKTAVNEIIQALKDKKTAGAMSIGQGAAEACLDVLNKCEGDKFVAMASYPTPPTPPQTFVLARTVWYFGSWMVINWFKCKMRGIRFNFIDGNTLVDNGLGKVIYEDFLPRALAEGSYIAAPEPQIVGKGLVNIQLAFDVLKKGVSATKVVVTLE